MANETVSATVVFQPAEDSPIHDAVVSGNVEVLQLLFDACQRDAGLFRSHTVRDDCSIPVAVIGLLLLLRV
jgi:hypothetical protein